MTTAPAFDRMANQVFDTQKNYVDTAAKIQSLMLPDNLQPGVRALQSKLPDPVTLIEKGFAFTERVLGTTETGKLVTRQKETTIYAIEKLVLRNHLLRD